MKKSKIAKIIWVLLIIILILGIGCLFFLPKLYDVFKDPSIETFGEHTLVYRFAFFTCYIICFIIIYKLICLFKYVFSDTPFKKEVEKILKVCAVLFIIIFLIVTIKAFFIPTILTFGVAFVCLLSSLSFYCLAEVIKAAICYKNEIDYTV